MATSSRVCLTLIAAVVVTVVSLLAIVLLFETLADERRSDLRSATVEDIASLGTCIETVSPDAIGQTEALKTDWLCDGASTDKERLQDLLAASTHSIYFALQSSTDAALVTLGNVVLPAALGITHGAVDAATAKAGLEALEPVTMPASCDDVYAGATAGAVPSPVRPEITCTTPPAETANNVWSGSVNVLYAHCLQQFAFGSSGPAMGSFGIPVFGEEAGPNYWPLGKPSNYTGQTASTKARLNLAYRFGMASWSYSVLMLALGFCFLDGIMVLVADGTETSRHTATAYANSNPGRIRRMMLATTDAVRERRWVLLLLMWIVAVVFLSVFLWAPFGFGYRMGRPICETNEDADDMFRVVAGSRGGWKSDWTATANELMCAIWVFICLFLLPLARTTNGISNSGAGSSYAQDMGGVKPGTSVFAYRMLDSASTAQFVYIVSIGTVLMVSAFAIVGTVFGFAWIAATTQTDGGFSANVVADPSLYPGLAGYLSGLVWTTARDAMFVMIACGMAIAAVQGRWLIVSFGGCSAICVPTMVWILMALLPIGLIFVTIGLEVFTDEYENSKECEVFDGGFNKASCVVKWIFLIIGGILITLILALMVLSAILRRFRDVGRVEPVGSADRKGIVVKPAGTVDPLTAPMESDMEPLLGTITRSRSRKLGFHLPIRVVDAGV